MGYHLGTESELAETQKDLLIEQAESFFDNIDNALNPLRSRYMAAELPQTEALPDASAPLPNPSIVEYEPEPVELLV